MTSEQLRRLNLYMLAIAIGALVSAGGIMQNQLITTGEINYTPILAAMLGSLITGLSTSVLPALKESADRALLPAATDSTPSPADVRTWSVIHRQCGRTAFLALVPPAPFEDLQASETRHIDGRPMAADAPIVCDSCSAKLAGIMADQGQWVTVSAPQVLGG